MVCRRCGCEFDTRRNLLKDGSTKCPKCGVVYRKKTQSQQNRQHSQVCRNPNSEGNRYATALIALKKLLTRKLWKFPVWLWLIVLFVIYIVPTNDSSVNESKQEAYNTDSVVDDASDVLDIANEIVFATDAPTEQPSVQVSDFNTIWDYAAHDAFGSAYGGTEYELLAQDTAEPRIRFKVSSKNAFVVRVCQYCQVAAEAEGYSNVDYDAIRFWGWMELVDVYGNVSEDNVFRITIPKDTLDKINWDNFSYDNLTSIGEDYWEASNVKY